MSRWCSGRDSNPRSATKGRNVSPALNHERPLCFRSVTRLVNRATLGRACLPPEPRGIGARLTISWCQLTFFAGNAEGQFDYSAVFLLDDLELSKLSFPVFPSYFQILYRRAGRPSSAEVNRFFNSVPFSLEDCFDAPVRPISHPTPKVETMREVRCFGSEEDSLNAASYVEMSSHFQSDHGLPETD